MYCIYRILEKSCIPKANMSACVHHNNVSHSAGCVDITAEEIYIRSIKQDTQVAIGG